MTGAKKSKPKLRKPKSHKHKIEDFDLGYDGSVMVKRCVKCGEIVGGL